MTRRRPHFGYQEMVLSKAISRLLNKSFFRRHLCDDFLNDNKDFNAQERYSK